jgi:hypothetical protein
MPLIQFDVANSQGNLLGIRLLVSTGVGIHLRRYGDN